jgi:hypothetical protein
MLAAIIVSLGVASYSSASAKEPEHRHEQEAMRCKKFWIASRHEEEYPRLI